MRSPPARASQQAASVAFALLAEPFRATAHRRAKALGYGMRSPPARAMADYFFKDCNCGQRTDARRVRRQGSVRSPSTLAATERGWYAIAGRSRARCPRSHDGRSAACRRDARAPRQWRDALRAGATPAYPALHAGATPAPPGEQLVRRGRSAACGRDARAPRGAGRRYTQPSACIA
jgi:hypothetical protein